MSVEEKAAWKCDLDGCHTEATTGGSMYTPSGWTTVDTVELKRATSMALAAPHPQTTTLHFCTVEHAIVGLHRLANTNDELRQKHAERESERVARVTRPITDFLGGKP